MLLGEQGQSHQYQRFYFRWEPIHEAETSPWCSDFKHNTEYKLNV